MNYTDIQPGRWRPHRSAVNVALLSVLTALNEWPLAAMAGGEGTASGHFIGSLTIYQR